MTATAETTAEAREHPEPERREGRERGGGVLRAAGTSLSLLGVLVLGFVAYLFGLSSVQHARDQKILYADFRYELAQGTAPVGPTTPGRAVAVLEIPRLGLKEVVVEGTASRQLALGPGHRRDTPLPGQPGISVLYGRSGTFGGPFGDVARLRGGDVITVATGQGLASYRVNSAGTPLTVPAANASTLLLVTADSGLTPGGEAAVSATLTSPVVPGNSTRPVIGVEEVGLRGDTGGVVPLILWAEALLLAVGATTWAYQRWTPWPTYVTSTPVLLAIVWNIYESLARLLPNTL